MSHPMNSPYPNYAPGSAAVMQTVVINDQIRPASTTHIVIAWVLAVVTAFYWLPWAIAATRNHQSVVAIALINLFFGWTGIGWLITLVWACLGVHTRPRLTSVAVFGGYDYPQQAPAPYVIPNQGRAQPPTLPPGNPGWPTRPDQTKTEPYETPSNHSLSEQTPPQQTWPQYRQPG